MTDTTPGQLAYEAFRASQETERVALGWAQLHEQTCAAWEAAAKAAIDGWLASEEIPDHAAALAEIARLREQLAAVTAERDTFRSRVVAACQARDRAIEAYARLRTGITKLADDFEQRGWTVYAEALRKLVTP